MTALKVLEHQAALWVIAESLLEKTIPQAVF